LTTDPHVRPIASITGDERGQIVSADAQATFSISQLGPHHPSPLEILTKRCGKVIDVHPRATVVDEKPRVRLGRLVKALTPDRPIGGPRSPGDRRRGVRSLSNAWRSRRNTGDGWGGALR
jgi:hypothetical protein